jgi:hypothetical protein
MWFWKNNGPRPPWGPDEILGSLGVVLDFWMWCWLLRMCLYCALKAYCMVFNIPVDL